MKLLNFAVLLQGRVFVLMKVSNSFVYAFALYSFCTWNADTYFSSQLIAQMGMSRGRCICSMIHLKENSGHLCHPMLQEKEYIRMS